MTKSGWVVIVLEIVLSDSEVLSNLDWRQKSVKETSNASNSFAASPLKMSRAA